MYGNQIEKYKEIKEQIRVVKQVYLYKNKSLTSKLNPDFIFQECTPEEIINILKKENITERYQSVVALSMCNDELQAQTVPELFEETTIPIAIDVDVDQDGLYAIDPVNIVDIPLQIPFQECAIPEYDFDVAPTEIQDNNITADKVIATSSQRQSKIEKSTEGLQLSDPNIRGMSSIVLNISAISTSQYDTEQPIVELPLQSISHQPLSTLHEQPTKDQTEQFPHDQPLPALLERPTFEQPKESTMDQPLPALLEQSHDRPEQFAIDQPLQANPELQELSTVRDNQIDIDPTETQPDVVRTRLRIPMPTSIVRPSSRNIRHVFEPDKLQNILNADIVNKYLDTIPRETIDWNTLYGNQPVSFLLNDDDATTMDFNQLSLEMSLYLHLDRTDNLQSTQSLMNQPVAEILEPTSINSLELPSADPKQILTENQVVNTIALQNETLVTPTIGAAELQIPVVITEDISAVMANQSDLAVPIQKLQTISVRNQIHIQDEVSALPLIVDDVRNPKDAQRQETLVPPTVGAAELQIPVDIIEEIPVVILETSRSQSQNEVPVSQLLHIFDKIPNQTDAIKQIPKEKMEIWYKNKLMTPYGKSVGNFINYPHIEEDVKSRLERMRMFVGHMEQLSAGMVAEYPPNNRNQ